MRQPPSRSVGTAAGAARQAPAGRLEALEALRGFAIAAVLALGVIREDTGFAEGLRKVLRYYT